MRKVMNDKAKTKILQTKSKNGRGPKCSNKQVEIYVTVIQLKFQ